MSVSLYEEIDRVFHPRSVAAVGISEKMENMGMNFLIGHRKMGFAGPLYAIHPNKVMKRFDSFPSLSAAPGPVDHVKICVPASAVAEVMKDCVNKGVHSVTVFSSGFRESGTEEGKRLEDEVLRIAREGGVRVIGPNCMGLHYPKLGLSIRSDMPKAEGGIGLVSQSGGISISAAMMAAERGLGFSKAVSYGNESDLGAPEFLHYLARDPETKVILLYIEGTRRPDELRAALRDAAARKPVVLLKGGITETGNRAVASHTGALTGAAEVWRALARQTPAALAEDIEELLDLAMLYTLSAPPPGRRVGLFTVSGGFGVFATDQVIKAGFTMPELSREAQDALRPFIDAPGTSIKNPLDLAAKFFQPQNYTPMFQALDSDPNLDCFIVIAAMEYLSWINDKAEQWAGFMVNALAGGLKLLHKPVYIVFFHTAAEPVRLKLDRALIGAGFPVYPNMGRCLTALNRSLAARRPGA